MLHPSQFEVNEAWIAFQLNSAPIRTARDGSFNCVALMDAASCYIFGTEMIPLDAPEPSPLEARRLLKAAWAHKKRYPATLFVPKGRFPKVLPAAARRQRITVVAVEESELAVFVGEAQQGFRERFEGGAEG